MSGRRPGDRQRRRRLLLGMAVALLGVLPAGCDAGSELTEGWVERTAERNREALLETQREELPLPEGVPVHAFGLEDLERPPAFEGFLTEELVVSERGDDQATLFEDLGRAGVSLFRALAVDDAGRIYVLERGGPEVRVFGPDGEFLRRFGRAGEGPGDLQRARGIALAPGGLLVFHRRYRTSVWTPEGEFVEERPTLAGIDEESLADIADPGGAGSTRRTAEDRIDGIPSGEGTDDERQRLWSPEGVFVLDDGSTIASFRVRGQPRRGRVVTRSFQVFSRFRDGEETIRYVAVPNWSRPAAASTPRGDLHVGMFGHLRTEFFIVAFEPDGTPRWMVILPWPVERPPQLELRVDGEGRLWAFPWVTMAPEGEEDGAPVPGAAGTGPGRSGQPGAGRAAAGRAGPGRDRAEVSPGERIRPRPRSAWVFSPEGELLAVGTLERRPLFWNWQVARGDRVYGIRRDAETLGEWEVVRYRLAVPF